MGTASSIALSNRIPVGLPCPIAHNFAAVRVFRMGRDPHPFQRHTVHPRRMAAFASKVNRMLRRHRVQLRSRRKRSALPHRLVPAPARQPLTGRRFRSPLADLLQRCGQSPNAAQIDLPQTHPVGKKVDVGVNETGHDRRAPQINLAPARRHQRPHITVAARGRKAVPRDRHRRNPGSPRVHRTDVTVE